MMPGRFFLGVGTGENLNEHVTGARWPLAWERLEMLEEAVDVIRKLWSGDEITHRGQHYTVEQARLYTLPDERAGDLRRRLEAAGGAARRPHRRRAHLHRAGRRARADVRGGGRLPASRRSA